MAIINIPSLKFNHGTKEEKGYIIVTGAAGFIGSCMVQYLNEQGYTILSLLMILV
jgi:hypothetical protein